MRVLGIETSCDETGIAVYDSQHGLLAHILHSQIDIHSPYGGVVPELASRDHIRKVLPLLKEVLEKASIDKFSIDAIAYTAGPGLVGALLVGATIASSLAFSLGIHAIGVHHMEAHLLAALLEDNKPSFPFVGLLVSGGHTLLIYAHDIGKYDILGETLDDAAGEAFDKVAKILGLPYPGGPYLASLAQSGNKDRFHFPRPMVNRANLDFSFSGLKTAALHAFQDNKDEPNIKADIACAFQDAIVDTLYIKSKKALLKTKLNRLVVAGGVSANLSLRSKLNLLTENDNVDVYYPRLSFCTDNGAMIAYTGYRRMLMGKNSCGPSIKVYPKWEIQSIDV